MVTLVEDEELPHLTALALARAIRVGRVSARRALEVLLRRVEELNPRVNAVIVLDAERARRRADDADAALARGEFWGPLHGVPCTVKEGLDVAGLPTCLGFPEHRDRTAPWSAVVAQRLLAAGAVIFGKTNVPLGMMDVQTFNAVFGSTSNPWDPARTSGGSSGGSAVSLACGFSPLEVGSDVGGSIRTPAAFCGVYGHKTTYGIIPNRGPHSHRPDEAVAVWGPLARCPEDLAMLFRLLVGADERIHSRGWRLQLPEPAKFSLGEFRVAFWADDACCPVDDELREAAEGLARKLEEAGASVDRRARPEGFDPASNVKMYISLTAVNRANRGEDVSHRTSLNDYARALQEQQGVRDAWESFFDEFDVLICPSYPTSAFLKDEADLPMSQKRVKLVRDGKEAEISYAKAIFWAVLTNTAWLPSTTFPCGVGPRSGRPLGLNVVSREYNDLVCLDFVRLLRQQCGLSFQAPPGFGRPPAPRGKL
mmetsp:Transcript_110573/g.323539  ORF Transcript_110573/g.323539 Transcript_110573/m.323539 type:complete len:482 (-) Transcript_110573:96-1541(-)